MTIGAIAKNGFTPQDFVINPSITNSKNHRISASVMYIEEHYESTLAVPQLAERANMSQYHYIREFKRYTGYSPNQYIIQCRIHCACHYLTKTPLSVEKIACIVGYDSLSHFCRLFKRNTGVNPLTYRKRYMATMVSPDQLS